jgi:3-phosphoshikimate 1-carboxyvinyltransferase
LTVKEIKPTGPVCARIKVPGSKSITNRALICAALAEGDSILSGASDSDDTALMANGLNQLGVLVRRTGSTLVVSGTRGRFFAPKFPIPVGNAGTTLRFLLSVAGLAEGKTVFESDDPLLDALDQLGVKADSLGTRFTVQGGGIAGGSIAFSAEQSSQFLSSLLMVAPYAKNDVNIEVDGRIASLPYIDMTMGVMKAFGMDVSHPDDRRFTVKAGQRYKTVKFFVEPDASGASYFMAAAAIAGGEVSIEGLGLRSGQGDVRFVKLLEQMGCDVEEENGGIVVRRAGTLHGINIDMNSMPDVVPTLAVTALFAEGSTHVLNVGHLRFKESDRLQAIVDELKKLGADITIADEGLEIRPAPLHGAQVDTYDDHRLAMSFALVGLKISGVKIENPDCVSKSFPGFWKEFEKLY